MDKKEQSAKTTDSAYLEKLEFQPELRKSWFNFFVSNFRVVILMILLISGWGIYSFLNLPRESNPEVKIPVAVVVATFPGASPSDMEELVTKHIETDISGVQGINKITSTSANSVSSVTVEFDSNQDVDDAVRRLRDQLQKIRQDIPEEANDPQVIEISLDDTPIVTYSLTGPYDGFTLRNYAETIQDELEKIPGVREANISGGDEMEFEVAYDPQKLTFFNISVDQANRAIMATNQAIPAGNFEGTSFVYPVRSDARFYDTEALENIPVSHADNGSIVYLKDLAEVREAAIKKTVLSRLSSKGSPSQESVTIQVVKRVGSSITDTVDQSNETIDKLLKTFPSGIKYETSMDLSEQITKDFEQLTHDFLFTLGLVVGILLLIVGLKEAFVAGLAIPLVFFATFGVMLATGISLNFLSIFSLLLSLGLLVDDAIVVVSATKQYMKSGKFTPEEAVLLVLNDFKVVLTSTTLATIWAFLPLLMSTGIMGEFIKSIPITVSVTLFASLLIALMINHPLAAVLERIRITKNFFVLILALLFGIGAFSIIQHSVLGYILAVVSFVVISLLIKWYFGSGKVTLEKNKELMDKEWEDDDLIKEKLRVQSSHESTGFGNRLIHGIVNFDRLLPIYEKYLRIILASKKRRIAVIAAVFVLFIFAVALPVTGIVKSEFFPASNEDIIFLSLRGPAGLNLNETDKIIRVVEERLMKYPEISSFSTLVGNPGQNGGVGGGGQNNSNTASVSIELVDKNEREITSYDFADKIRENLSDIKDAKITIASLEGGPPAGAAFQAQISGEDLQTLDKIAQELKPILDSIPGTVDSDISLKDAPAEYTFELDPAKMELYNLNAALVGGTLRTAISGSKVSTVIRSNKTIDVNATFQEDKIPDLESIQNLQILNTKNSPVYIRDVAEVKLNPSVESITRIDQKRTILLTSDVKGTTSSNQVVQEFQDKVAQEYNLPDGYEITYGGENEQNTESVLSIIRAMAIAGILIVSTLIIQFNSFKKAIIVLVTLPLALIGVFIGMAIFQVSLSFPGLIGILALFGIVVKNAIILIDKINLNIKSGIPFKEAVIDAGKSRSEAIFITSVCTIAGIIPITLSNALWTALGSAIIFGLSISSFFTLFVIPVLYLTFVTEKERL